MSNLRDLRKRIGLKATELAEMVGTSKANISRWESGTRRLTAEIAVLIDEKTGGRISRHDLRPDIFGEAA
jgi:DNA-binding transcriptional regulator YdaS (Cro superfamily)